ncbi:MAG: chemotaxis protein CheD [Pseudomonadota bacterium]
MRPTVIHTALGSCVAICLMSGAFGAGGMCHCLMPNSNGMTEPKGRFVDLAVKAMVSRLAENGIMRDDLEAKLFGGAQIPGTSRSLAAGPKNVAVAHCVLEHLGIPLVAESTGGILGRKIFFDTGTGEVILKWLHRDSCSTTGLEKTGFC